MPSDQSPISGRYPRKKNEVITLTLNKDACKDETWFKIHDLNSK